MRAILPFSLFILLHLNSYSQERMTYVKNDKNPGVAFSLSMFAPGAGQMYNDQVSLGLGVFLGTMALYGGGALLIQNEYTDATRAAGRAMLVTGGLAHLGSLIYAPLKARQINRANGDTAVPGKERKSELGFGITSTGGAGLTLAF